MDKPKQPTFLVDEMLQRFGRWLRAAGYDTEIATDSQADYYLLKKARDEGRYLLTRDRELAKIRRAEGIVILLTSENLDDCAKELGQKLDINWQFRPFTRCMVCNTELDEVENPAELDIKLNEDDQARYCPTCRQVFWDGSHVNRMRSQLSKWQQHRPT